MSSSGNFEEVPERLDHVGFDIIKYSKIKPKKSILGLYSGPRLQKRTFVTYPINRKGHDTQPSQFITLDIETVKDPFHNNSSTDPIQVPVNATIAYRDKGKIKTEIYELNTYKLTTTNIRSRLYSFLYTVLYRLIKIGMNISRNPVVLMHNGGSFDFYILLHFIINTFDTDPLTPDNILTGIMRDKRDSFISFKIRMSSFGLTPKETGVDDRFLVFKDSMRMFEGDLAKLCSLAGPPYGELKVN